MQEKICTSKIWDPQIVEMKKVGKTKREIADRFVLTKEQVKDLLKHYRRRAEYSVTVMCIFGNAQKWLL